MPVQSIECLLTQTQVKRYLSGADFPDELLVSLESHLKACPDCMAEANKQRQELGGAPAEATAVVETPPATTLLSKFKSLFPARAASGPLVAPPGTVANADPWSALRTPKNLLLSGGLAFVLIVMSMLSRNPSALFGPRALPPKEPTAVVAAADPAHVEEHSQSTDSQEPEHAEPVQPHVTEESAPKAPETKATTPPDDHSEKATHATPTDAHASEPKATPEVKKHEKVGGEVMIAEANSKPVHSNPRSKVAKRTAARRRTAPAVKRAPKRKATSGVRVYLPDGTPKN